jgi:drug/metabolite transporter (DMT)-like permease
VVNYLVAFLFGLVYSKPWAAGDISLLWMPSALQGGLFILLFQLIGLASQRIGISPTTVASKMSLALTVLITVLIFREQPSALAWSGIALAVLGVTFSSWGGGTRGAKGWWLLPVIFFASAISDVLINAAQRTRVTPMTEAVFPTMIFGFAALFGLGWLVFRTDRVALLHPRTWFWGALLGGVNYGSIYFLVLALSRGGLQAACCWRTWARSSSAQPRPSCCSGVSTWCIGWASHSRSLRSASSFQHRHEQRPLLHTGRGKHG